MSVSAIRRSARVSTLANLVGHLLQLFALDGAALEGKLSRRNHFMRPRSSYRPARISSSALFISYQFAGEH